MSNLGCASLIVSQVNRLSQRYSDTSESEGRYKYGRAVNSFILFLPNIDDGDPGIVILFADEDSIHEVLNLSAIAAIPSLDRGTERGWVNLYQCFSGHEY